MGTKLTPERITQIADDFIDRNPEAWEQMKLEAERFVSECKRFSIKKLSEEARYGMRLNGYDDGFKINNSCLAVLARRIIDEVPGADGYISTRSSKVDGMEWR